MTEVEKYNFTPQETGFTIGHNPPPKTVQIDCDTIILKQRELEISFKLESAKMETMTVSLPIQPADPNVPLSILGSMVACSTKSQLMQLRFRAPSLLAVASVTTFQGRKL